MPIWLPAPPCFQGWRWRRRCPQFGQCRCATGFVLCPAPGKLADISTLPPTRPGQEVAWLSTRDLPLRSESRKLSPCFNGPLDHPRYLRSTASLFHAGLVRWPLPLPYSPTVTPRWTTGVCRVSDSVDGRAGFAVSSGLGGVWS